MPRKRNLSVFWSYLILATCFFTALLTTQPAKATDQSNANIIIRTGGQLERFAKETRDRLLGFPDQKYYSGSASGAEIDVNAEFDSHIKFITRMVQEATSEDAEPIDVFYNTLSIYRAHWEIRLLETSIIIWNSVIAPYYTEHEPLYDAYDASNDDINARHYDGKITTKERDGLLLALDKETRTSEISLVKKAIKEYKRIMQSSSSNLDPKTVEAGGTYHGRHGELLPIPDKICFFKVEHELLDRMDMFLEMAEESGLYKPGRIDSLEEIIEDIGIITRSYALGAWGFGYLNLHEILYWNGGDDIPLPTMPDYRDLSNTQIDSPKIKQVDEKDQVSDKEDQKDEEENEKKAEKTSGFDWSLMDSGYSSFDPDPLLDADPATKERLSDTIGSGLKGFMSIANEPADWALTFGDWAKGDFSYWDILGLVPLVNHTTARALGKGVEHMPDAIRLTASNINRELSEMKYILGEVKDISKYYLNDLLKYKEAAKKFGWDSSTSAWRKKPLTGYWSDTKQLELKKVIDDGNLKAAHQEDIINIKVKQQHDNYKKTQEWPQGGVTDGKAGLGDYKDKELGGTGGLPKEGIRPKNGKSQKIEKISE